VQIAKETLAALPFTLQTPAPDAWIDGIGDSTVTLRLIGWIDQRTTSLNAARGEAIRIAMAALSDAAIDMPEPTYRLTGLPALDPAEDTAPEPAPEPARPGSPVATPALDVQAHAEHALEAIVDEERRDKRSEDLLTHDAPTE
jgi:small conductance mechanosensitive channel